MGGDLNLKKSWHPLLMSNQRRVYDAEKAALAERRRTEQMLKERAQERQVKELQDMQEAAGGTKKIDRVDWMYNGPSAGQNGTTEEMESFLLGKRRIDVLLKDKENKSLEKAATEESVIAIQKAHTMRDTASKLRDDPMFAIKKQEQQALELMMKDPAKRRALLEDAGESRKHRKHRHRRDRRYEYERQQREPRTSSASTRDDRHYRDHRYEDERPRHESRRRSVSPEDDHAGESRKYREYQHRRDHHYEHEYHRHEPSKNSASAEDDRAAKLATMQQAAADLEEDRKTRLKASAEKDAADWREDDAARARSGKSGGKGDFLVGMNRRAGELGMGERMQRGRKGYEHDDD